MKNRSEKLSERGQISTISPGNSHSIAQESGGIWAVQTVLQPISFKSDRLLEIVKLNFAAGQYPSLERRCQPVDGHNPRPGRVGCGGACERCTTDTDPDRVGDGDVVGTGRGVWDAAAGVRLAELQSDPAGAHRLARPGPLPQAASADLGHA